MKSKLLHNPIAIGSMVMIVGILLIAFLMNWYGSQKVDTLGEEILKEIASTLLQLVVIGVIGLAIQHLFNQHQERNRQFQAAATLQREQREGRNELRRELLRRLVAANRQVRKARILIPAHGSARTYGEQMRALIDVQFEYGDIEHEIKNIPDLFQVPDTIINSLKDIQSYLSKLTWEYQEQYMEIRHSEATNNRQQVMEDIENLPRCREFISDSRDSDLRLIYLENYWTVLNFIRAQIKQDLTLSSSNL